MMIWYKWEFSLVFYNYLLQVGEMQFNQFGKNWLNYNYILDKQKWDFKKAAHKEDHPRMKRNMQYTFPL